MPLYVDGSAIYNQYVVIWYNNVISLYMQVIKLKIFIFFHLDAKYPYLS